MAVALGGSDDFLREFSYSSFILAVDYSEYLLRRGGVFHIRLILSYRTIYCS